jgi:hypothetical protein
VANGTIQEWGQVIAGSWKIQRASGQDAGSLSCNWVPESNTLQAVCITDDLTGAWTASADPSTGQLRHHTINSDGSSDITQISKKGPNQWDMAQDCVLPDGQLASNKSSFIVTDNGNTLIQKVTNRTVSGLALPDVQFVLTRQK